MVAPTYVREQHEDLATDDGVSVVTTSVPLLHARSVKIIAVEPRPTDLEGGFLTSVIGSLALKACVSSQ